MFFVLFCYLFRPLIIIWGGSIFRLRFVSFPAYADPEGLVPPAPLPLLEIFPSDAIFQVSHSPIRQELVKFLLHSRIPRRVIGKPSPVKELLPRSVFNVVQGEGKAYPCQIRLGYWLT